MTLKATAHCAFLIAGVLTTTIAFAPVATGQETDSEGIIQRLSPPRKPILTRSLGGNSSSTSTRGIKVEPGREAEVLDSTKGLPSINIRVTFDHDSDVLTPDGAASLKALGLALRDERLTSYRFLIGGHTDATGTDEYNQKLSERRARSVLEHLVATYHVAPDRLSSLGFGKRRLADPTDPTGSVNRRVEIVNIGS